MVSGTSAQEAEANTMVKKAPNDSVVLLPARDQVRHNEHRKQTWWPMRDECNDPSAEQYEYTTANARDFFTCIFASFSTGTALSVSMMRSDSSAGNENENVLQGIFPGNGFTKCWWMKTCLLYTSPSPRD